MDKDHLRSVYLELSMLTVLQLPIVLLPTTNKRLISPKKVEDEVSCFLDSTPLKNLKTQIKMMSTHIF